MSAFDRLCWFAERFPEVLGPSLPAVLRTAHLFSFPHVSHDVLPKSFNDEELVFYRDHFVLPFNVVAVEDRTSVVLLWDEKRDQVGLCQPRFFMELAPMSAQHADTWKDAAEAKEHFAAMPPEVRAQMERSYTFSFGQLKVDEILQEERPEGGKRSRYQIGGTLMAYLILDDQGPTADGMGILAQHPDECAGMAIRNGMIAIEELMAFNRPDRFIVRETPPRLRDPGGPKIPRAHERHNYTLLHPTEIRQKLNLPAPQAGTGKGGRFVGERRRHVRRYPDDPARWPKAHGKTIVVPATWVGPSEAKVGRRQFQIMLDL